MTGHFEICAVIPVLRPDLQFSRLAAPLLQKVLQTVLPIALLATAGCAALTGGPAADAEPPAPAPAEPTEPAAAAEAPEAPALTAEERAQIESLLARADRAIAEDHLTYPADGSALDLYDQVRILDPDNDAARRGLERIVERYLELAMSAAERGRFSQARAMMDRARLVDPDHAGVVPTQARIDLLDTADRQVIELDATALSNRTRNVTDTLRQVGVASRGNGCRADITARSDSEGRWIYQQMSTGGGERIQAQLNIGSEPRIEVLCIRE